MSNSITRRYIRNNQRATQSFLPPAASIQIPLSPHSAQNAKLISPPNFHLNTRVPSHRRFSGIGSSGYKVSASSQCGQIFLRLADADTSLGARIFVDTPIISFLSFRESIRVSVVCKLWWSEVYSLWNIRRHIMTPNPNLQNNINSKRFIWQRMLLGESEFITGNIYMKRAKTPGEFDDQIERDIGRTFPTNSFFQENGNGQKMLFKVLRVCAWKYPEIGYCQGMNFIAGVLLTLYEEELISLQCMCSLLENYNLKDLFLPQFEAVKRKCFQMESLLNTYLPDLAKKLIKLKLSANFYAVQWLLTLFSYDIKPPHVYLLWEVFMLSGWKTVFKIALVLLEDINEKLVGLDMEQSLRLIKARPKDYCAVTSMDEILSKSAKYKVTNKMLDVIDTFYNATGSTDMPLKVFFKPSTSYPRNKRKWRVAYDCTEVDSILKRAEHHVIATRTERWAVSKLHMPSFPLIYFDTSKSETHHDQGSEETSASLGENRTPKM